MPRYECQVERSGFGMIQTITLSAPSPEVAAAQAEAAAASNLYGGDWAHVVHQFFTFKVREIEPFKWPEHRPMHLLANPDGTQNALARLLGYDENGD